MVKIFNEHSVVRLKEKYQNTNEIQGYTWNFFLDSNATWVSLYEL